MSDLTQMCNPPHPGEVLKELWVNMQTTHDLWEVRQKSSSFLDSVQTLVF